MIKKVINKNKVLLPHLALISHQEIEQRIFILRGHKVMIDRDLAELYGVLTKDLNRQVKRNVERFPEEFMFRLTLEEKNQLVTSCHRFQSMKHSTVLPSAFTEYGVTMLSSILHSPRAIKISIFIVKTFIKIREILSTNRELARRLEDLERKVQKNDHEIMGIFQAIKQLLKQKEESSKPKEPFGFQPPLPKGDCG